METFRYKAVRASGEVIEDEMEARDRDSVIARLSEMGCIPIRADRVRRGSLRRLLSMDIGGGSRVSQRQIMIASREIATLLESGVELERALEIVVELSESAALREIFADVLDDVRGGSSLADALDRHRRHFSVSYVSMVRAGEVGGALEVVYARIADFLERAHAARESIRSALIYPIILLVMAVIAVAVMVTVVLPQFEPLFANAGRELPLPTRIMLSVTDVLESYGLIALLAAAALVLALRQRLRDPRARLAWHRRVLSIPLWGGLVIRIEVARLTRTLGTLLQNGVATLTALSIVRETVGNSYLAAALDDAAERVQAGATISDALARVPRFPDLAAHLIRVGEETGRLEEMLLRTSQIYEDDSQRAIQRLLALLLPALTALLGLFIAAVIASVFLAVVSVNQLAF